MARTTTIGNIARSLPQRAPTYGPGGVSVPNYYTGNYSAPNMMTGNYQAGNAMTGGSYGARNYLTGNYGAQNFINGDYGARNFVNGDYGAKDFFKGFQNISDGKFYFNDKTLDMVDKAGDMAGLEAEASRLLGRSGGVQAAMMAGSGGFNGGLADMQRSMLASNVMGGLARDINADRYNREMAVQEGTFRRQEGLANTDAQRAGLDLQYRGGRQQNAQFNAGQRLGADQARNQASQFNSGQRLAADSGRNQASQFNSGQRLNADMGRNAASQFNAGQRLSADTTRQGTMNFNAGQRYNADAQRQQNAQFNANMGFNLAGAKSADWLAGEALWNQRLGMGANMMQNPAMGYVDPRTGLPSAQTVPPGQWGGGYGGFGPGGQPHAATGGLPSFGAGNGPWGIW